jgi:hypothetical protein
MLKNAMLCSDFSHAPKGLMLSGETHGSDAAAVQIFNKSRFIMPANRLLKAPKHELVRIADLSPGLRNYIVDFSELPV